MTATLTAPAFTMPTAAREFLTASFNAYELPANPTSAQIGEAWEMRRKLDEETGMWLRQAFRRPESAAFYTEAAQAVGAAAHQLTEAIKAFNPAR